MATIEFMNVQKSFDDGTVAVRDLSLKIEDGEFMIFVGPSGCGKTTALRMVAGLEDISSGEIRIGGKSVNGLDPQDRDIAMVFQSYALYPHMNVRENLAFPLRMQSVPKPEIDSRVRGVAEMLGITPLLGRRPRELSGGQRQRVAMGRAIVRHPQAFLMDEPLSNLDAKLRIQMRVELARLHRRLGVTTIYVTHDQTEAMTLGQRVTVINEGRIQQVAPPKKLYDCPANAFVAGFIGSPPMNFLRGRLTSGGMTIGGVEIPLPASVLGSVTGGAPEVLVGLRPESLVVAGSGESGLVGEIEVVEELGAESYVYLKGPSIDVVERGEKPVEFTGSICARLSEAGELLPGERMTLAVRPELIRFFDEKTGASRQAI